MTTIKAREAVENAGKTWEEFELFMNGQAVGVDESGKINNWYDCDVARFCRAKRRRDHTTNV